MWNVWKNIRHLEQGGDGTVRGLTVDLSYTCEPNECEKQRD